jgi:DNA-binding NarL/FixJ family response regulator
VAHLRPDVILLDIGLPDIDGFVVAERLVAADAAVDGSSPPAVVLVSSRSRAAYAGRLSASPAVGFIGKDEIEGPALTALLAGVAT